MVPAFAIRTANHMRIRLHDFRLLSETSAFYLGCARNEKRRDLPSD